MIVLLVLFLPAALTAYLLHNLAWLVVVPFGIIILALFIAALPTKRKVTPEQFAEELERHLLGTGVLGIGMTLRQSPTNVWSEFAGSLRSSTLWLRKKIRMN
jgi:uncharacterized membrane protein YedE/YeeE